MMNNLAIHLLAQTDRYTSSSDRTDLQQVSKALNDGSVSTLSLGWLLVIGSAVMLVIAATSFVVLMKRGQLKAPTWWMFDRLAAEQGLSFAERWWLLKLAKRQELASPITLLLTPGTLTAHAHRDAPSTHLDSVMRKLFGG